MHVRVDEAGHERHVAEVDALYAIWMLHGCADLKNPLAFDENLAGLKDLAGIDLKKTGCVQDDGRDGFASRRLCECRSKTN
jgi:hypothetical protein